MYIEIDDEHICITDGTEEVVYWDHAEWEEDPSLTPKIAFAIYLATHDPDRLRYKLRHWRAQRT